MAKTDTYGLYNSDMARVWHCRRHADHPERQFRQLHLLGHWQLRPSQPTCPVYNVSWGDAARFCNWLQNGQPTGAEGTGTTETGAYTLNGATIDSALMAITRNAGAKYFHSVGE